MGLLDYIWPHEKKFTETPGARESAIAAMVGGIGTGASTIIIFNHPRYAYKTSLYSGFLIFWVTFLVYGVRHRQMANASDSFVDAYKSGKID